MQQGTVERVKPLDLGPLPVAMKCQQMKTTIKINHLLQESAAVDEEIAPVSCRLSGRSIKYLDKPLTFGIIPAGLNDLAAKLDELL
jgi:hypothetical protein